MQVKMESGSDAEASQRWAKIHQLVDQPYSPPTDASGASQSPPLTLLDAKDMPMFGATPLEVAEGQNVVRCKDCSKPILESAVAAHAVNCQKIRDRKLLAAGAGTDLKSASLKRGLSEAGTGSDTSTSPMKKPKSSLVVSLGDSLKLPLAPTAGDAHDASKPKKKKDKDKSEKLAVASGSSTTLAAPGSASKKDRPSTGRPGEIDVEKQCGVINDKGFPCSRALTCKSHSMGAKRSVPHRSQPYDILLHEWQKATKPDFKNSKPVQPRVGPGSEAYGAGVGGEGGKKKKKGLGDGSGGGGGGGGHSGGKERRTRDKGKGLLIVGEWEESDPGEEEDLVDSEDEVECVLRGISRIGKGRPLSMGGGGGAGFSAASLFAGRNSKLGRLREVLGGVFGGAGRPISGGTT